MELQKTNSAAGPSVSSSVNCLADDTYFTTTEQFKDAMRESGIILTDEVIADGKIHRFHIDGDKPGSLNGWYVLYEDSLPAGAFGSWKLGISQTWCSKSSGRLSTSERRILRGQIVSARKQEVDQLLKTHTKAAARANSIWDKSRPVINHPYLKDKQVKAYGIRQNGSNLVIPLRDTTGALHSLQFIKPNGGKLLLSGGKKSGHFHLIGDPDDVLLVAEGYSTAATLYEATGYATAMAVDAGNLKPVGRVLRKKYPLVRIVFCADNDQYGEINTGINKATEAAKAVNGYVATPIFQDVTTKPTDFNDLQRLEDLNAIGKIA